MSHVTTLIISLIYNIKRIGLRTLPCGQGWVQLPGSITVTITMPDFFPNYNYGLFDIFNYMTHLTFNYNSQIQPKDYNYN